MGLTARRQLAQHRSLYSRRAACVFSVTIALWLTAFACERAAGQSAVASSGQRGQNDQPVNALASSPIERARRFLGGRTLVGNVSAARAMVTARKQNAAMLAGRADVPNLSSLSAAWQPLGPNQVGSIAYGDITGRVTSIAIDPADQTGNTVYLGTTGGGVWKSSNAAGSAESVSFTPLTDTLPVYSANVEASRHALAQHWRNQCSVRRRPGWHGRSE